MDVLAPVEYVAKLVFCHLLARSNKKQLVRAVKTFPTIWLLEPFVLHTFDQTSYTMLFTELFKTCYILHFFHKSPFIPKAINIDAIFSVKVSTSVLWRNFGHFSARQNGYKLLSWASNPKSNYFPRTRQFDMLQYSNEPKMCGLI